MEDEKIKQFKLGVTVAIEAPVGCPFPIVDPDIYQSADWLSTHGFDSMEVHIRAPEMVDGPRLKAYLHQRNLETSSIGTGMAAAYENLTITSEDTDIVRSAVQRLKNQIDLGAVLQCPVIIGSMHGNIGKNGIRAEVEKRMIESCKELADYAEKMQVDIVIEAIDRSETDYLKTTEEVLDLIEHVGSERIKVHLDTFHMNIEETDWRIPVLAAGKRLGHVHIADNTRRYPGSGMIDFKPFLKALKEVDYKGSLVLECYPDSDGYEACIKGKAYLEFCIAKCEF